MLSVDVDLSVVFDDLDRSVNRAGKSVKKAVYLGAKIVRDEAILRAPQSAEAHIFKSGGYDKKTGKFKWNGREYLFYPGDLKKSIYIAYSPENSVDDKRAEYHVSWRTTSNGAKGLLSVPYAYWVEFGNARMPAHPFVKPAFDAKHRAVEEEITKVIREALTDEKNI